MSAAALKTHLMAGASHVCHCWRIKRRDGLTLGFTDHDLPLAFDGATFTPEAGLSARAVASTTGLAVNNTEAIGALSADAISEADIAAGRYDGAEVTTWLVCWNDPEIRQVRFRGTLGEITRGAGAFQAELLGLTEALNQPQGRSYLKTCSAVVGDGACSFDLTAPGYAIELAPVTVSDRQHFSFAAFDGFNPQWFENGLLTVLEGPAEGLKGVIKSDIIVGTMRLITLWEPVGDVVTPDHRLRLTAGCDKRAVTCREKFGNMLNFRGFPDIPGDDWLAAVPRSDGTNTGGSLNRGGE